MWWRFGIGAFIIFGQLINIYNSENITGYAIISILVGVALLISGYRVYRKKQNAKNIQ